MTRRRSIDTNFQSTFNGQMRIELQAKKKCPERFSSERKEALGGVAQENAGSQSGATFPAENPTPAETRQMHAAVTGETKTFHLHPLVFVFVFKRSNQVPPVGLGCVSGT